MTDSSDTRNDWAFYTTMAEDLAAMLQQVEQRPGVGLLAGMLRIALQLARSNASAARPPDDSQLSLPVDEPPITAAGG